MNDTISTLAQSTEDIEQSAVDTPVVSEIPQPTLVIIDRPAVEEIATEQVSEPEVNSVESPSSQPAVAAIQIKTEVEAAKKTVVDQVGQLTRTLHNSLRELGYDKRIEDISTEVPETQDRLSYVALKTKQAAERALNATDIAMPIQEKLSTEATDLSKQWKEAFESQDSLPPGTEKFKDLLVQTLAYLNDVPKQTGETNTQLMEIMMAQDFQDLTGQVIMRVAKMVQDLEYELLQLLVANAPQDKRDSLNDGLMNGPVVKPEDRNDVVADQSQVDDLLASLGF